MTDLEEMMEKEFKEFQTSIPKKLVRERKLPNGQTIREWGPFVYGYSMTIGPNGKPNIWKFGNVRPSQKQKVFGFTRPGLDIREEREPLIDVINTDNEIEIVVELPGVSKKDIRLHGTEETLAISVNTQQRKYFKEVTLPAPIDPKKATTTFKHGVLEIKLPKTHKNTRNQAEKIDIE
jgi:HSP20 family protein